MKNPATICLLAALLLVLSGGFRAFAQSKSAAAKPAPASAGPALSTYQGEYEGGRATYTYYLDEEGQRVRHGRFEHVRLEKGHSLILNWQVISTDYVETRGTGTYADGDSTGRWTTTVTEYSLPGNRHARLPADLTRRQTTTRTYVGGDINGPATYADVPWRGGKPGTPTTFASAGRRTRSETRTLAVRRPYRLRGEEEESAGRDTTRRVTEYAAGPFRYDAAPDASDPAHRLQTARGYFDANGYCDSTWTLRYFKGSSEGRTDMYGNVFTAVQRAGGWMTTTLTFANGVLRRERTTQASTGALISRFDLPASALADSVSRLVLLGSPAHLYGWSVPANHPDEPDWQSPIAENEDASGYFFREAARLLGPPLLLDVSIALAPTAADSALLRLAHAVHRAARTQWPDSTLTEADAARLPAAFGDNPSVTLLSTEQWRLLATDEADEQPGNTTAYLKSSYEHDWSSASEEHPHPWLEQLMRSNPHGPVAEAPELERRYLLHMAKIRLRTRQLQARLALAAPARAGTAPPGAAAAAPAKQ